MLALTKSGTVYSWGYGADGQLGQSSLYHFRSPKQIDHFEDHGASIVDIECGGLYSAAVDDMGRLWTWGYGDGGWLGTHRSEDGEPPNFETEDPTEFPFIEGHEIVSTFMSQMCVIVPKKVAQLVGRVSVRMVRCGDSHCVAIAD
jgi:alpha-tubulin suppressor-like RCC1 family protein